MSDDRVCGKFEVLNPEKSVPEQRPQRQLSAILAADVAGYSRLIGLDEEGTLARLKELRRTLIDPNISEHRGRIVKTMGDGLLVQFASVVDAVRCAAEIQRLVTEQQTGTAGDQRINFRIGINLGDIVIDGDDIHGDGVNVAARLEALAEPGGICVTSIVHDQVRDKVGIDFADAGDQQLKNIARPVRVYKAKISVVLERDTPVPIQSDKPSIAVLPFVNMSGDPDQLYFSDGVTEDIITELSRFRLLNVIARNSSFRFRGGDVDVIRVGRELGAQYVLEGSIRKVGRKIRITAQLIDASTGGHLWAERYDRDEEEVFAVQDQVVSTIVGTLAGQLEAAHVAGARRKPPTSLAAYDCVLRADALPFSDPAARAEARRLAERAIELDPTYSRAYAQLCISYHLEWAHDFSGSNESLEKAFSLAQRAVMLDESDISAVGNLGWVHMQRRSYDLAEFYLTRALALNPNKPTIIAAVGILYGFLGKTEEGIAYFKRAKIVDPHFNPTWYWPQLGIIHFIARNYDEAVALLVRASTMQDWVHCYLAACYALTNRKEDAARHAKQALSQAPSLTATVFVEKEPFKSASDRERLLQGLRMAGLPD
jgi:TolB-like protein/class 3 adenylate cyclase